MYGEFNKVFPKVNLKRFVSDQGVVDLEMIANEPDLKLYFGLPYLRFLECALEARPDSVKRLGSLLPSELNNIHRRELRGSLLAHIWIDNWDTREENTLLSQIHMGNYEYRLSGVFSDLGTSLGVKFSRFGRDFKAGLVNRFSWNPIRLKSLDRVFLTTKYNHELEFFKSATYSDLRWMALQISKFNTNDLQKIIEKSGYPDPLKVLYYHKLASRRFEILKAFNVLDQNPIEFDHHLNLNYEGKEVSRDGVLTQELDPKMHPEGFIHYKGRFRNYGGDNE